MARLPETTKGVGVAPRRARQDATVGVLIVNWNSGSLLARCLDALAAQQASPQRVLVVDNASSDGSERAAEGRPGIELLQLPGNFGFADANNRGIQRLGDCEWIALLNPDAFPEPGWLAAGLGALGGDPSLASLASRQISANDRSLLDGTGDLYSVTGLAWRRHHGQPASTLGLEGGEVFGACAAAGFYRRDALLEIGGFDTSFFCYFEDVDVAFRLRLRGYRCRYVPEAVVHHIGSALTGVRSDFAVFHGQRNAVWTFFKNMPAPLLVLYLPHHLLMNLASVVVLAFRGQGGIVLRAKWAALRGLPAVARSRRSVQAARRVSLSQLRSAMIRGWRAFGLGRSA